VSEQVKAGDKVWVLCEVAMVYKDQSCLYMDVHYDGLEIQAKRSDCRPVEPVNNPKIPNSSSEPMRAAFESSMAKKYDWYQGYFSRNENRYFDSSVEMAWQAYQAGAKYQSSPLAPSPCMDGVDVDQFIDGIMEARGRTNDPVNPSHYKQGGIECIEAIKAALGEGFPDYLRGNVMKYLWRYKEKGGVEDLRKSAWYLDRLFKEAGE
jgi:hypothetical protein